MRNVFVYAVVVACTALSFGCGDQRPASEHIAAGQALAKSGDLQASLIEFRNAVKKAPNDADARWQLGQLYLRLGDGASAVKELSRGLELGIQQADGNLPLVRALIMQGKLDDALKKLGEVESSRASAEANVLKAQILSGLGRVDEARQTFQLVLQNDPSRIEAYTGLAQLEMADPHSEPARALVDQALKIDPHNARALYLKGEMDLAVGDLTAAEAAFGGAQLDPNAELIAKLGLARSKLAGKDFDAALKLANEILAASPNHPFANYVVGLAEFGKEKLEPAREAFQRVLAVTPDHIGSLQMIGAVQYQLGQYAQAEVNLAKLVNLAPSNLIGRRLLGATRLRSNDARGAIDAVKGVVDNNDDLQLLLIAGTAYQQLGDIEKSRQYLERAATLAPDEASIQARLGLSNLLSGDMDAAVAQFELAGTKEEYRNQAQVFIALSHLRGKNYQKAAEVAEALTKSWPESALPHNLAGTAWIGVKNNQKARQFFEQALAIDPGFTPARLNLARVAISEDRLDDAETALKAVLDHDAVNERALIGLAQLAASRGNDDQVREYLEQARSGNNSATQSRLALARYYLQKGDTKAAVTVAQEANKLDPKDPAILLSLAQTTLASGDRSSVRDSLEKVVSLRPDDPAVLTQAAILYRGMQDDDLAKSLLDQAINRNPDYAPAITAIAQIELKQGDYTAARVRADKLDRLLPQSPEGPAIRGDAAYNNREFDRAIVEYQAALKRQETNTVITKLHQSLLAAGRPDDAFETLEVWLKKLPDDDRVRFVLATSFMQEEQFKKAVPHLEKMLTKQSENGAVLNNLAWAYYKLGNPQAKALAERAHKAAPDRPEILDTVGWIFVTSGEADRGIALLENAYAKFPASPDIRYHLAAGLAQTGAKGRALSLLNELFAEKVDFPDAEAAKRLALDLNKQP